MHKSSILLTLVIPSLLLSENNPTTPNCFEEHSCLGSCSEAHFRLSQRAPGGIGYTDGYSSLDFFYAPAINHKWHSLIDLRGHLFNNKKWATNTGLGFRYLPDCQKIIYGINTYWDFREHFQQLGAGLELLGPRWDAYLNGYAPYNRQKSARIHHREIKYEVAMSGFDASLGYWLWSSDCLGIHAAIGGYFFKGDFHQKATGGLINAKLRLTAWFDIKAQISYDSLFKWRSQGEIALNLPFGKKIKPSYCDKRPCSDVLALGQRLVAPPERFEIIVATPMTQTPHYKAVR